MPQEKSEIRKMAERLCKKYPDHPARSLARILVEQTGGVITLEHGRKLIRLGFGIAGKSARTTPVAERPPRKPGARKWLPKSQAEEWKPVRIEGKNIGIISDIHVPYHSELAVNAALDHLKSKKIDHLLINGDLCDFYSISRFQRKPSRRNFKNEMAQCRAFLEGLRSEFPRLKITLKKGNHEVRWDHWLWEHAPEIAETEEMDLATWLRCDELGIQAVNDLDLIEAGELPILHGHELGKGIAAPVNPARGAYLKVKHTILVSHHHQTSGHCEPDLYHTECFVWSIGCLCDLRPDYHKYGKSNWGFARVTVEKDGGFQVENYRINQNGSVRTS